MAVEQIECKNGNVSINVQTRNFLPDKGYDYCNRQDLILFPGWGPDENAKSYENLAQSLADNFGRQVHIINTKPEKIIDDSLFCQAKAAANYIKKMEMSDVIVAGYSEGAAKAINLTSILQESSSNIKPESLVLFSPVCINHQTPGQTTKRFLGDGLFETIPRILTEKNENGTNRFKKANESRRVIADITMGIAKDAKKYKSKYPEVLVHQIREIAKENPRLEDIKVPIILVQGKYDKAAGPKGDLKNEELIEEKLERLFPNSPHIDRILLKQSGNHAGILVRSKEVAKLAAELFKKESSNNLVTQDIQVRTVSKLVI